MRVLAGAMTGVLALAAGGLSAEPAPAPGPIRKLTAAEAARVARLIEQMGSRSYRARQKAYETLGAMGPEIIPVLQRYRTHADAEIAARVLALIRRVGWTHRGAIVLRLQPGTQAERVGFRPGDVVVKVDDEDMASARQLVAFDNTRPRTCYVWRRGEILTKKVAPGKIGIYVGDWQLADGGNEHARGLSAVVEGRFEAAYRYLLQAQDRWAEEPLTRQLMIGLAEYNLDHDRAMKLYHRARAGGELEGNWSYNELDEMIVRGLPFSSAYTADLLERLGKVKPSEAFGSELGYELDTHFLHGGRNFPLARELTARPWPRVIQGANGPSHSAFHDLSRMQVLLHDRRYRDAVKYFRKARPGGQVHRLALRAALGGGDVGATCDLASRMLRDQLNPARRWNSFAYTALAIVAARAAGREDAARRLGRQWASLQPRVADIDDPDLFFILPHLAWSRFALEALRAVPAHRGGDWRGELLLSCLMRSRQCTPAKWEQAFAEVLAPRGGLQHLHWYNAAFLLARGRYAQARRAVKSTFPRGAAVEAFGRAVEFLTRHAPRVRGEWSALQGTFQLYDGAEKGSHWAVRYDGRTFYVDPRGKLHEPAGLTPGEVHQGLRGERIHAGPTGTIYVRRAQVYLLDDRARRWMPTYASQCTVPANAHYWKDATAPAALSYVLKEYPIRGAGRELLWPPLAAGGRVFYQFRGELALAVERKTGRVTDIGREVRRLVGREGQADVYRIRPRGRDRAWIPTNLGLWTMNDAGRIAPIELPALKSRKVMVSVLPWPKRAGKTYVGVASHQGGQVFEIDTASGNAALTEGYCGVGPEDSFAAMKTWTRRVYGDYAVEVLLRTRPRSAQAAK